MIKERKLYYYERMDKKVEVALEFIEDLKNRAERQGKIKFAEYCKNKIDEINSI